MEQAYLRRYMCNLNETSSKSLEEFKIIFDNEIQNSLTWKESIQKTKKKFPSKILFLTKIVKNLMRAQM